MHHQMRLIGAVLGLVAVAAGCGVSAITPIPGPMYADPNGNPHLGVAVAGKDAGGPCLQGPVCLVPAQ